jgi:hypothetical protein
VVAPGARSSIREITRGLTRHAKDGIMRNANRGRLYRRCGCRDASGTQLGAQCPQLTRRRHGTWAFAVDLPTLDHRRRTLRRSGFPTKARARAALDRVLACERAAIHIDDRQTVADYLEAWLETKQRSLKPTTLARYLDYVRKDLVPTLGAIRLEELTHHHIASFVTIQLAAGRGPVTVHSCIATLSSALTDAVRHHRLIHNPARFANIPRPPTPATDMLVTGTGRCVPAALRRGRRPAGRALRAPHVHRHAQRRSARPALGGCRS